MAGPILHSETSKSRRRWLVILTCLAVVALLISFATHYRQNYYGQLSFPSPDSHTGYSNDLQVKEFVKPPGIKIIGFVFFGRRSRVEILRCFLEVPLLLHTPLPPS